jgi:hypothetical protein
MSTVASNYREIERTELAAERKEALRQKDTQIQELIAERNSLRDMLKKAEVACPSYRYVPAF